MKKQQKKRKKIGTDKICKLERYTCMNSKSLEETERKVKLNADLLR